MSINIEEFDFSGAARDLTKGLLVKPILHNYLFNASFPEFDLHFRKQDMERDPDDWFHPSTHPLMHDRLLFEYLTAPATFPVEKKQYMGTLAVMMGKVVHEFIQICLTDAGIRPTELQQCAMCPPEADCHEAGVKDEVLGERGHLDGVLTFEGIPQVPIEKVEPVFEYKTSHDNFGRLTTMDDLDLDAFRKKWPDYWAQVQRYMKMSGRRYAIVLMMETVYPFVMKEFHVPFDPGFNAMVDTKYRDIRQAVADQRPPMCCGNRGCAIARTCGVLR